jgi:formiminotetrahydrofolate cyclodeaminase
MTENHDASLWGKSLLAFRNRVAADTPTPGGGAVAAVTATLAAALLRMVCAIGNKRKADSGMNAAVAQITVCEEKLARYADEDIRAFDRYIAARKVHNISSTAEIQRCLLACTEVPLAAAEEVAKLNAYATEVALQAPEFLSSDVSTAQSLLEASHRGLLANVTINLVDLEDSEEKHLLLQRLDALLRPANTTG